MIDLVIAILVLCGEDLGNLYNEKAEESHVEESQEQIETPVPPEEGLVRGQAVEQDINLIQGAWLVVGEEDKIAHAPR